MSGYIKKEQLHEDLITTIENSNKTSIVANIADRDSITGMKIGDRALVMSNGNGELEGFTYNGNTWIKDSSSSVGQRSVTIVVAASNSSTKSKSGADFICTGTNDEVKINDAFNALPTIEWETGTVVSYVSNSLILPASRSGGIDNIYVGSTISITSGTGSGQSRLITAYITSSGNSRVIVNTPWTTIPDNTSVYSIASKCGKVLLLEGIYKISNKIIIPSRCSLDGEGSNSSVVKLVTKDGIIQPNSFGSGSSQISISNIRMIGDRANSITTGAIDFYNCHYSKITNVSLQNIYGAAISINTSSTCIVDYCLFDSCYYAMAINNSTYSKFNNNIIGKSDNYGINATQIIGCEISENIVSYCPTGIIVSTSGDGNSITDNVVTYSSVVGINSQSNISIISLNRVSFSATGILVDGFNNSVTSNNSYDNTIYGFHINGKYNSVTGNNASRNANHGFHISNSDFAVISSNESNQNGTGINLTSSNQATISNNMMDINNTNGIALALSSSCLISNNTITSSSQGITETNDNIFIDDTSSYNTIEGNTLRSVTGGLSKKARYGIRVNSSNCNGNTIVHNNMSTGGGNVADYSDLGTGTTLIKISDYQDQSVLNWMGI